MRKGIFKRNIIFYLFLSRLLLVVCIWLMYNLNGYTSEQAVFMGCITLPSTVLCFTLGFVFISTHRYFPIGERVSAVTRNVWNILLSLVILPQIILVVINALFSLLSSTLFSLILSFFDSLLIVYAILFMSKMLFPGRFLDEKDKAL